MKKILIRLFSIFALFSLFVSCDGLTGDNGDPANNEPPPEPVQYDETAVLFEGEQKIDDWWGSDDVILQINDPAKFEGEINALQITYNTKKNTTPKFKIANKKDWKEIYFETVRGDGYLYEDYTVDLLSNKENGIVVCKLSKDVMELISQNGLLIYGTELTITKVSLVNDTSTEPGNIHENPLQIPRELENDIVVWEGTKEIITGSETFKFTNVEENTTDANALRITFTTNNAWNTATYTDISPVIAEYHMGKGLVKNYADPNFPIGIVQFDSVAKEETILIKISDDKDYNMDYIIRCGLTLFHGPEPFTINKIVLTKLEETVLWEGEKEIGWGADDALLINEPKIPEDAKSIIVEYTKPEGNTSIINFNNSWWEGKDVYSASGNYAINPGYKKDDENSTNYPLVDQRASRVLVNCVTSFVFTSDQFKDFADKGLLINGQDITITKIRYMKYSEKGPETKSAE